MMACFGWYAGFMSWEWFQQQIFIESYCLSRLITIRFFHPCRSSRSSNSTTRIWICVYELRAGMILSSIFTRRALSAGGADVSLDRCPHIPTRSRFTCLDMAPPPSTISHLIVSHLTSSPSCFLGRLGAASAVARPTGSAVRGCVPCAARTRARTLSEPPRGAAPWHAPAAD